MKTVTVTVSVKVDTDDEDKALDSIQESPYEFPTSEGEAEILDTEIMDVEVSG